MTRVKLCIALAAMATLIAACNDDDDDGPIVSRDVDSLGDDFARAFDADPNDEPLNAQDVDLELTPRLDPIDI